MHTYPIEVSYGVATILHVTTKERQNKNEQWYSPVEEQDHIALRQYLEKQFGRLDILVNNAGVTLEGNVSELGPHNTVLNVPIETVRKTYEIKLLWRAPSDADPCCHCCVAPPPHAL
jgi:NAD(P)-dependent dehydrogenase (short-subunit alcohol dehydrogenase family)